MPTRLEPGAYEIGETETREGHHQSVFVLKGEYINESRSYGLDAHMDVSASKWFVVTATELSVKERGTTRGTYVVDRAKLHSKHDTKGDAVDRAERMV